MKLIKEKITSKNLKVGIIGLGYVGLPLAVEFGKKYHCIGFDVNDERISQLKQSIDKTFELTSDDIDDAKHLNFTSEIEDIKKSNIYIVTVPTPIDNDNNPDITFLIKASEMIGTILDKGDIVIYELSLIHI